MEDTVIKMIFSPRSTEPVECIQSLLILSLWHLGSGGTGMGDGRLLITSAVTIAMNLRLNEASTKITGSGLLSDSELLDATNEAILVRLDRF